MNANISTNSLAAWILACRPKTLGAMLCPVLIGTSLSASQGHFNPNIFLITLSCALLLQILANLVNDYGDFKRGHDTEIRLGPPRAMAMGFLTDKAMLFGIAIVMLFILISGLILIMHGGWPIFLLGIMGIFTAIWYTAGPWPLAYLGFSEIVVWLFFGTAPVLGSFYVQSMSYDHSALLLSLSPSCLAAALMITNNLRDIEEDRANNKKTMSVRLGAKFSRLAIIFLLLAAGAPPIYAYLFLGFKWPLLLSLTALIIPASKFKIILFEPISRRFNLVLAAIGQSLYIFGLILSLGVIYASGLLS